MITPNKPNLARTQQGFWRQDPIWRSLVGAWFFNEGRGLTAYDASGYRNNGTLTNMEVSDWIVGKYGNALDFDGSTDYITIGHKPELNLGNRFTISLWVYPRTLNVYQFLWGKISGATDGASFRIHNVNSTVSVFPTSVNGDKAADTNALTANVWQHVVVSATGANFNFYVNGVSAGNPTYSSFAWSNTQPAAIARRNDVSEQFLNAIVDHVYVFNRSLSENEIKGLYFNPFPDVRRRMWFVPTAAIETRQLSLLGVG